MVVMVMIIIVVIVVIATMVIRIDRKTGHLGQTGQTGPTDLTFKLDFPGTCVRQLSQFLYVVYMVWYALLPQPGTRAAQQWNGTSREILTRKKQSKLCKGSQARRNSRC